jgi:GT2 family glycosyltransferase
VFGQCRYIDSEGKQIWLNRSGRWASPLMLFGPQLVPQPGSLIRREEFEAIGGLDESLKWAFDLDMFLKLRRQRDGLRFLRSTLSEFRWHNESLSVGSRIGSVEEASQVRSRHLPVPMRQLSGLWEPVLRRIIYLAGTRLSKRII